MPKEPGENNIEGSQEELPGGTRAEIAEHWLLYLSEALNKIEKEELTVDETLKKPSSSAYPYESLGLDRPNKGEGLRLRLDQFKKFIDYLNPEQKQVADGLVIKAEIYLAAHEPKKE